MMNNGQWRKSKSFRESLGHAWRGVAAVFKNEKNIQIQLIVFVFVFVLALFLRLPALQMAVIIVISALVLSLEMINTSLEVLADVIRLEFDKDVRKLKDVAAAAVMVASIAAVVVGLLLLVKPLMLVLFY